jgi:hypothetical protein
MSAPALADASVLGVKVDGGWKSRFVPENFWRDCVSRDDQFCKWLSVFGSVNPNTVVRIQNRLISRTNSQFRTVVKNCYSCGTSKCAKTYPL